MYIITTKKALEKNHETNYMHFKCAAAESFPIAQIHMLISVSSRTIIFTTTA